MAHTGHGEWPTPVTPMDHAIVGALLLPGFYGPGLAFTNTMESDAKLIAEDLLKQGFRVKGRPFYSEEHELERISSGWSIRSLLRRVVT